MLNGTLLSIAEVRAAIATGIADPNEAGPIIGEWILWDGSILTGAYSTATPDRETQAETFSSADVHELSEILIAQGTPFTLAYGWDDRSRTIEWTILTAAQISATRERRPALAREQAQGIVNGAFSVVEQILARAETVQIPMSQKNMTDLAWRTADWYCRYALSDYRVRHIESQGQPQAYYKYQVIPNHQEPRLTIKFSGTQRFPNFYPFAVTAPSTS